jgi:hypothetical protein
VSSKRSKVHPKYKTKYRVRNWPAYDRSLVARGDNTLWITPEAVEAWRPARTRSRGAQPKFSDLAIETALTLRLVFHLPLRQAEGFLRSIVRIMGLDLESPDHTTLSRRGKSLALDLRPVPHEAPIHLLIDSNGLAAFGEGEWAAAKHGAKCRRGWRKQHLSVNPRGVIMAQRLTKATTDDASTALDLLDTIKGRITCVTADGAYDTAAIYEAAGKRGAHVVVPPSTAATASCKLRLVPAHATGPSSAYRRSGDGHGRSRRDAISMLELRTPSSATRRWSVTACVHAVNLGAGSRRASHAMSSTA